MGVVLALGALDSALNKESGDRSQKVRKNIKNERRTSNVQHRMLNEKQSRFFIDQYS